eukprot:1391666-Amphidinium_carterae.1
MISSKMSTLSLKPGITITATFGATNFVQPSAGKGAVNVRSTVWRIMSSIFIDSQASQSSQSKPLLELRAPLTNANATKAAHMSM